MMLLANLSRINNLITTKLQTNPTRLLSSWSLLRSSRGSFATQAPYSYTDAELSKRYDEYRPTYGGTELYDKLVGFCKENGSGFDLAIDVGCGSGQGTLPLTQHFKKVVGVDASEVQIAKAPKEPANLSYVVSAGEDLGFVEDGSADLVTASMCLHYLDRDKFFKEADRVLKPKGSLGVYVYSCICELSHPELNAYFNHVLRNVTLPYYTEREKTIVDCYGYLCLPYDGWTRDESLSLKKEYTVSDLIGYLESLTSFRKLDKHQPERKIAEEIKANLLSCVGEEGLDTKVQAEFPAALLMGTKP